MKELCPLDRQVCPEQPDSRKYSRGLVGGNSPAVPQPSKQPVERHHSEPAGKPYHTSKHVSFHKGACVHSKAALGCQSGHQKTSIVRSASFACILVEGKSLNPVWQSTLLVVLGLGRVGSLRAWKLSGPALECDDLILMDILLISDTWV